MNDDDEIDIYEEFGYVDLSKECEKLQAEISKLQEENGKFLSKIDTLVNEKEKLVQKNRILQKNISTLLKTAKEEIKRKDAKILELRVELTKVQAKKNIKENPVDENFRIRNLTADSRLDPDENKFQNKGKIPIDVGKFDKRHRLSEKVDEVRLPRTRRDDDRYRKYQRRRSRSPVKTSKSKSPHRKRVKSPVGRKRRRSRTPIAGVKRRRSRTRSPKKVSKSPVRLVPNLDKTAAVLVKPFGGVEVGPITPIVLPPCEEPEITDKSSARTPEEPRTGSTDQNEMEKTFSPSIDESPTFSEIIQPNESFEREDGEIVSDQGETVDTGLRKTLYTARMEQRLKKEDEDRVKEINPPKPPESAISPNADDTTKPEQPEAIVNTTSVVETYSPFKNNYKLVPWSPAPKKPDTLLSSEEKKIEAFNVDKPVKPLVLADIATGCEAKKAEPKGGFDIKSYRIPKKKTDKSEPVKKDVKKKGTNHKHDVKVVENGLDMTEEAKEAGNDIANFEIFKTINSKNTSSSSMDVSSESRRLHNDLHLTDSDVNVNDSEATSAESSNSDSNTGASDIMEQFL